MQLSTALSDGVLAAVTITSAVLLIYRGRYWCAVWMTAIALAAIAGTLRFSGFDDLIPLHSALSRWAAMVAFPSFCWAMMRWLRSGRDVSAGESLAIAAGLNFVLLVAHRPDIATAVGAVALFIALIGAQAIFRRQRSICLMLAWAIGLYAIAGLWITDQGTIGPMLRIDVYHCALAAANLLFGVALWKAKPARSLR